MNLATAPVGVPLKIMKVRIKDDQKKQLANMGFVEESIITVVSATDGNMIVNVKGARIGIGIDLSSKIMVIPNQD